MSHPGSSIRILISWFMKESPCSCCSISIIPYMPQTTRALFHCSLKTNQIQVVLPSFFQACHSFHNTTKWHPFRSFPHISGWKYKTYLKPTHIWMFPKIGVPPNHPFFIWFSIINHPFWGSPILGNTYIKLSCCKENLLNLFFHCLVMLWLTWSRQLPRLTHGFLDSPSTSKKDVLFRKKKKRC